MLPMTTGACGADYGHRGADPPSLELPPSHKATADKSVGTATAARLRERNGDRYMDL